MGISDAIRAEVAEMGMHPYDINDGYCEDFAMNVIARLGGYRDGLTETTTEVQTDGAVDFVMLPGHVWIECDGLHYDAEEPEGVAHWWDLPFFGRLRQRPQYKDILDGCSRQQSVA